MLLRIYQDLNNQPREDIWRLFEKKTLYTQLNDLFANIQANYANRFSNKCDL